MLEPFLPVGSTAEAAQIGPLIGDDRLKAAYELQLELAERLLAKGIPEQTCNGDEEDFPVALGNFTKGLGHHATTGEVDPGDWDALLTALASGDPSDFELVPLAGVRKLVNPQSGLAFDTRGERRPRSCQCRRRPTFASAEQAGEIVEHYWMALLRDVNFDDYDGHARGAAASADLNALRRRLQRAEDQAARSRRRPSSATSSRAPSWVPTSRSSCGSTRRSACEYVERKMRTLAPGIDHMTTFADWLAVQNGVSHRGPTFDADPALHPQRPRPRPVGAHRRALPGLLQRLPDPRHAAGQLGHRRRPRRAVNPGNPYIGTPTRPASAPCGPPASRRWCARSRPAPSRPPGTRSGSSTAACGPRSYAGRVEVHLNQSPGRYNGILHPSTCSAPTVLDAVAAHNSGTLPAADGLPRGLPDPSVLQRRPRHRRGRVRHHPQGALRHRERRHPATRWCRRRTARRSCPTPARPLTVEGELNKLASNVATGRNIAGVHWRTDCHRVAGSARRSRSACCATSARSSTRAARFTFTRFDGTQIVISP